MNKFKRHVIVKVCIFFTVVIFSAVFAFYSFGSYRKSVEIKNISMNRIFELKSYIADLHDREAVLAANLGLYKKVLFLKIKQESYMNDINNIVKELLKKHMLLKPDIVVSAPEEAKFDSYLQSDSLDAITGSVSISFLSISDINVFSFINSIRQQIPGYVLVRELRLHRKNDLDVSTIEQYGNMLPEKEIVNGYISFEWYGLKSIWDEK